MKILLTIAYKILYIYWKIFKPITVGVNILLLSENNKVILIRKAYVSGWHLPGGGVKRGETLEQAIKRETKEEIGGTINSLDFFGVYTTFMEGKSDHVIVFKSNGFSVKGIISLEIAELREFSLNNLPKDLATGAKTVLKDLKSGSKKGFGIWTKS